MIVLTAKGLATNMAGPHSKQQQKIFNKPKKFMGGKTALWLWPLVLYSLIQIATNLIMQISQHESNNNEENYSTTTLFHKNYIINNNDILFTPNQVISTTKSHKLCSSTSKFSASSPSNSLLSSLSYSSSSSSSTLNNDHHHQDYFSSLLRFLNGRTLFGGKVLIAEAASSPSTPYQLNQDKGIIVLNSTNFNKELIQNKHPFPHIKLIEYFVSFCGYCRDFKATYNKLAKEIYPWRNVIRPSAIDLSISSNSPIAHSWSVQEVPTLRIHPPPEPSLAEKLDKQLTSSSATLSPIELQKAMFEEYNSSKLMIQSLRVSDYKDKVPLLKQDLLHYIENYVQKKPSEVPASWPNLRPVTETSLVELRLGHPRQELFLIIDGTMPKTTDLDQSSASMTTSFGFNLIMELSSSATWKAIRYVRASENIALIEDVISHQNKSNIEHQENQIKDQIKLLKNLLSIEKQNEGNDDILLLHIDDSHSPMRSEGSSTAFPFMTLVTGADLMTIEKSISDGLNTNRVKRETFKNKLLSRFKRESEISSLNKMSNERKMELFASYIKEAYTETSEDREFVEAINNFDDLIRADEIPESANKVLDKYIKSQKIIQKNNPTTTTNQGSYHMNTDQSTLLDKIQNILKPAENQKLVQPSYTASGDYDDKVKALRYILFTEVPRIPTVEKSLVEQQEKLNTLVNLVTVIRLYFPFADSSSVEFIDGVQSYLLKQQSRLLSVKTQEAGSSGFDTRAFKQELKRLESENKRLPEIKDWKHCTGYPCALWRLFHTLTAFEYLKVKQIRQLLQQPPQPQLQSQQQPPNQQQLLTTTLQQGEPQPPVSTQPPSSTGLRSSENPFSNSVEVITIKSTNSDLTDVPAPPVERVVSPPSTTTSLSLTIATQNSSQVISDKISNNNNNMKPLSESDLPMPVILVMRDYITTFFSCSDCAVKFRAETAELSLEKIRHEEPAEFSILWLWETHNRVNKRLSVDVATNPPERPKLWFPSYNQCASCYKKPPSFLKDTTADSLTIFHESIEWNKQEILSYLLREYTKQPLDCQFNLFSDNLRYSFKYIIIGSMCCLILIVFLRCTTFYVERQRRHKATLLNGNGNHYSVELQ